MTPAQRRAIAEKSWGTRVWERRTQMGLTQGQVASIAGLTTGTVCRIEANKLAPRYRTMVAVSKALGCTVDDLFPFEAHPDRRVA